LGEFRELEDPFQEQGDLPELRFIGTQSFLEDASSDVLSLTGEFEQYRAGHAKHTPQALTVRFNLAQALEKIGKYEEAEHHYRKILSIESRTNVQKSLGMILAESGRLEESPTLVFSALTGFIVNFGSYSLLTSKEIFGLIFELFVGAVSRRGEKWDPFSQYMDQMMATLRMANSDEDMHRIYPQLFIHGFSFAHQCYILGDIPSAKWLYKYLLECPTVHFDNPYHQFEKFKAHYMYGLLLRKEKWWNSSAEQLLLACRSVMKSGSYDRRLIRLFRVIFSELRPHMTFQFYPPTLSRRQHIGI
jgi:tetratricopeptide (TPR) repeat protein